MNRTFDEEIGISKKKKTSSILFSLRIYDWRDFRSKFYVLNYLVGKKSVSLFRFEKIKCDPDPFG